jgi:uncharacterized repeat protein (TIGR01451 family)
MKGKGTMRLTLTFIILSILWVSAAFAEPFAYVPNVVSNNVTVIDTATNTVVDTIPVGLAPTDVAITPDGMFAYVANFSSNSVSVIETATNTVVATIPAGTNPLGVAITPSLPDLAVVKAGFPDPVVVGETLTYTVFVINYGPSIAGSVTLTDTLPAGVTFVSAPRVYGNGRSGYVRCGYNDNRGYSAGGYNGNSPISDGRNIEYS